MAFEYSKSGLPANEKWEIASAICKNWLDHNMAEYGDKGIENFMMHQPIKAAKLLQEHCPDVSEELVTLVLLGPAKEALISHEEKAGREIFGDRTVNLMKFLAGAGPGDAAMERDATRLYLVEGLSNMNDQIIGRKRIDKFHAIRWEHLKGFEENFATMKGQNPGLDTVFADALVKSRAALEALDDAAKNAASAKKDPKPPTP